MKNYDTVLFDLDGTLTDPGIGITNSVAYALRKYDIDVKDRTQLYKFIGPPLMDSFQMFYGFSKEDARKAIDYYREYYTVTGIFENRLYDGIELLLKDLNEAGKTVIVATSKPEDFAVQIMKYFDVEKYFTYIAGATMDETRTNKDEVIRYALESLGKSDSDKMIMIGDREYDIFGAKELKMDSIGVLFGYGSREELENAGATYIAENVDDIRKILL